MIHGKILEKFVEYQEYLNDDTAMVCAVLDVRLLGVMNCLPESKSELDVNLVNSCLQVEEL